MTEKPKMNRTIVCEELNYVWDEHQLVELDRLWREGYTINQIAKLFLRKREEIAIALIDRLSDNEKSLLFGSRWGVQPRHRSMALCYD
ncbi:hypothetical protein RB620_04505 [Paenibacillus sp. LHD-117]|uniref:hypothetical protein n=1 Tax=Paenibacillus sp. LHD-117 TaxID=3071412 RepID=UPI0027E1DDB7|nr:hypothetical protein [Paenibacillus sp. LHD-117]MDQ6418694.1 hypothetical protein [Paenibacillus sp. LHD-117]